MVDAMKIHEAESVMLEASLSEIVQRLADAISVLESLEWSDHGRCPSCDSMHRDGHNAECPLAKAIGK